MIYKKSSRKTDNKMKKPIRNLSNDIADQTRMPLSISIGTQHDYIGFTKGAVQEELSWYPSGVGLHL
jgi:hypothetical protein